VCLHLHKRLSILSDHSGNFSRRACGRPGFVGDPAADFRDTLYKLTGSRWDVEQRETGGEPSLREREEAAKAEAQAKMRAHPLVEAAFAAFPEAELVEDAEIQPAGRQAWGR